MNATKKLWSLALGLGLALIAGRAYAADKDSLTVTITPNVYYAVVITTGTGSFLDLGSVPLGVSTWTVRPATVTIQSTYAGTDLKLQGNITSAGSAWSFSADSTTIAGNELAAWAVFTDTSVAASPAQTSGYFNGTTQGTGNDMIDGTLRDVGAVAAAGSAFLAGTGDAGYKTMQAIPTETVDAASSRAHLWLRFRLPGSSSTPDAQKITLTLTAGAPN
jgi:hypothetical protein